MRELISTLVPTEQQAPALRLLDDPGSRHLIRQQLGQLAEDHTGLLPQKSCNWILCKLATFGAAETDTLRIYQAFLSQLNQWGQLCRLFSGEDGHYQQDPPAAVASRLTVGLGLFYEQAARQHQRRAAPSPQFYQQTAMSCFAVTGYKNLAAQLPAWLEFLRTNFVLPRM